MQALHEEFASKTRQIALIRYWNVSTGQDKIAALHEIDLIERELSGLTLTLKERQESFERKVSQRDNIIRQRVEMETLRKQEELKIIMTAAKRHGAMNLEELEVLELPQKGFFKVFTELLWTC